MRLKLLLASTALGFSALTPHMASAQSIPPTRYNVDAHGVDLVRKEWTPTSAQVSIGGPTGLTYGRVLLGSQWWDAAIGGMYDWGATADVTVEGITETFDATVSGFVPRENTGSTLTRVGFTAVYIYQRGGTTYRLEPLAYPVVPPAPFEQFVTRRDEPNGLRTDYTYTIQSYTDPDDPGAPPMPVARLQSYQNNAGYQIHFDYAANTVTSTNVGDFQRVTKVTGINLAVDFCANTAFTCTGLTRTWPSVAFSTDTSDPLIPVQVITDQAGVETRYRTYWDGVTGVREMFVGSNPTPVVKVRYNPGDGSLMNVTDASGTWDYTFFDRTATQLETTVEGPMGEETLVISDPSTGLITSATQKTSAAPTSRTWSWTYDAGYRLGTATGPEGETVEYDYDGRGNVTQMTMSPKTGSLEADIVTSATYPSTCAIAVTCNLPTSTTDAAGNVTNYTWDSTHGGPLTVTLPAPAPGADRPQTRYAYAAQTAQFKNSSGVIVAASTSVTLPVEVSACITGSSCDATANEILTTISYGVTTGVANNLNAAVVSRGSGTSPAMSVTTMTYTPDGDMATIDAPLSGTSDTTQYRYDTSRRVVGVVGPDPDGGGPGLNRAQRLTYNDRGQTTLTETGTTAGYSDPNWAAFSPLLKTSIAYDDYGRTVETRQMSAAGVTSAVQQVTYDAAGRVSCTAVRMNPTTFASLPSSACTLGTTGGFGPDRITQTTYDIADRPLATTTGYATVDPSTSSRTYTVGGQVASLTDGNGNVSVFEYDGFNRRVRQRFPNSTGGGTSLTDFQAAQFDAYGRLWKTWNRAGDLTTISYDNLNRITRTDAPSSADDTYYRYDLIDRQTSVSRTGVTPIVCDADTTCLGWDPLSRLTSETTDLGAMSYQYDAAGRMTRITWPDSYYAAYEHDLYGAVTAVRENGASSGVGVLATYTWNDLGQPLGIVRAGGAGVPTTYGYDAWGRLSSLSHNAVGSTNDLSLAFTYNPRNQIVTRLASNDAYVYTPVVANTAYDINGLNQVTEIAGVDVLYDANANISDAFGNAYEFDGDNRLVQATVAAVATDYDFDPSGRLALTSAGSTVTRFQYAGRQLTTEYNGAGTLTQRHVPGVALDDIVTSYAGSGTSARTWLLPDERLSVVALSDSSGGVSAINRYDEFGVPASGNSGTFQYTGQQWLPSAVAYNYRARVMLPQIGRFGQADPVGYAVGLNLYSYVGHDPINFADPLGTTCYENWVRWSVTIWSDGGVTRTDQPFVRETSGYCPGIDEAGPTDTPQSPQGPGQESVGCPGLPPGTRFETALEAGAAGARAAELMRANDKDHDYEYGGRISRLPGGGYTYTAPVRGPVPGETPRIAVAPTDIGWYHLHNEGDGRTLSEQDRDMSRLGAVGRPDFVTILAAQNSRIYGWIGTSRLSTRGRDLGSTACPRN